MPKDKNDNEANIVVAPNYVGEERRRDEMTETSGNVGFDDRGNAVWQMPDVPRRREDDDTLNPLRCLDVADLSLVDDEPKADDAPEQSGFNPYDKS